MEGLGLGWAGLMKIDQLPSQLATRKLSGFYPVTRNGQKRLLERKKRRKRRKRRPAGLSENLDIVVTTFHDEAGR